MHIHLLEPYFTGSHRQWAEGYRDHSRHEVHLITHEGQFWKWRLQGGFVTIAEALGSAFEDVGEPDALLTTSMLNLAGLRGLIGRDLPAALYMHENQVTYPPTGRTRAKTDYGLVNWFSVLAADAVAFNSEFHRLSFFEGLPVLLGAAPDRRHLHRVAAEEARSTVLPVGVDLRRLDDLRRERGEPPLLLWNHRWDRDKGLAEVLSVLARLKEEGRDFRTALAGESFVDQPAEHAAAIEALGDKVVHVGHLPPDEYDLLLRESDVVVSAARQEFFGVSVVEAIYAGAFPVLPDRLVYPERVPSELYSICLYRGRGELLERLRWVLDHPDEAADAASRLRREVEVFDWSVVAPRYDEWMSGIV